MLLNLLLKPLPEDKGPVDHLHNRLLSQNMLRHQGAQVTAAMERSLQHTAESVGVVTRDQLQTWQQDVSVVRLDARVSAPAVHVGCSNLIRSSVRQDDFDALPQHVVEVLVEFWRGSSVGSGRLMELRAEVTQHLSCPLSLGKLSGNRQQSRQVVNFIIREWRQRDWSEKHADNRVRRLFLQWLRHTRVPDQEPRTGSGTCPGNRQAKPSNSKFPQH